jgi:hypothetical protein
MVGGDENLSGDTVTSRVGCPLLQGTRSPLCYQVYDVKPWPCVACRGGFGYGSNPVPNRHVWFVSSPGYRGPSHGSSVPSLDRLGKPATSTGSRSPVPSPVWRDSWFPLRGVLIVAPPVPASIRCRPRLHQGWVLLNLVPVLLHP